MSKSRAPAPPAFYREAIRQNVVRRVTINRKKKQEQKNASPCPESQSGKKEENDFGRD